MKKGQTTIELLVLLAVSMIALGIIYTLYADQTLMAGASKDSFIARSTVQKIVDASNTAYLAGKDSEIKIYVEIPDTIDLTNSGFSERSVYLRLANGTDIVGTADANFSGSFRSNAGKYYMYLYYDGNVVNIRYRDYEFNKQSIFAAVTQGTTSEQTFTIRNNSESSIEFWVVPSFSHSLVTLNLDSEDDNFTLESGGIKTIDFNFVTDATAYGNYAGAFTVSGLLSDTNIVKLVYLSVESFLEIDDLMIYPRTINVITTESAPESQDYSICNHSSSNITGISWGKDGNASGWFDVPTVTAVNALQCEAFTIEYTIGSAGEYDSNVTATHTDGNTYTSYMNFTVS